MSNEIVIMTPEHVELHFELAGPGSRLLALLIDSAIIILAVIIIILLMIAFAVVLGDSERMISSASGVAVLMIMLLPTLYFFLFEAFMRGKTPGKNVVGLRVIRDTGHAVDTRAALLRNLMRLVDQLPIPPLYLVGSLVVFFSAQSRRIGDYVGGTLVVREPRQMSEKEKAASQELYQTVSTFTPPQDYTLPDQILVSLDLITKEDHRAIRHLLDRSSELEPIVVQSTAKKMVSAICEKLACESSLVDDPVVFLHALSREWERRKVH